MGLQRAEIASEILREDGNGRAETCRDPRPGVALVIRIQEGERHRL